MKRKLLKLMAIITTTAFLWQDVAWACPDHFWQTRREAGQAKGAACLPDILTYRTGRQAILTGARIGTGPLNPNFSLRPVARAEKNILPARETLPIKAKAKVERKGLVVAPGEGQEFVLNAGALSGKFLPGIENSARLLFARIVDPRDRPIPEIDDMRKSAIGLYLHKPELGNMAVAIDPKMLNPDDKDLVSGADDIISLEDARVIEEDGIVYVYLSVVRKGIKDNKPATPYYDAVTTCKTSEFIDYVNGRRADCNWTPLKRLITDGPCKDQNIKDFVVFSSWSIINGKKRRFALYRPEEKDGRTIRLAELDLSQASPERPLEGPWKDAGVFMELGEEEEGWLGPSTSVHGVGLHPEIPFEFIFYHRAVMMPDRKRDHDLRPIMMPDGKKYYDLRLLISDKNNPMKFTTITVMMPDMQEQYVKNGWKPGVIYSTGAVLKSFDVENGKYVFDIYYSEADTVVLMATVTVNINTNNLTPGLTFSNAQTAVLESSILRPMAKGERGDVVTTAGGVPQRDTFPAIQNLPNYQEINRFFKKGYYLVSFGSLVLVRHPDTENLPIPQKPTTGGYELNPFFREGFDGGLFFVFDNGYGSLSLEVIYPQLPATGEGLGRAAIASVLLMKYGNSQQRREFRILTTTKSVYKSLSKLEGFEVKGNSILPWFLRWFPWLNRYDVSGSVPLIDASLVEELKEWNMRNKGRAQTSDVLLSAISIDSLTPASAQKLIIRNMRTPPRFPSQRLHLDYETFIIDVKNGKPIRAIVKEDENIIGNISLEADPYGTIGYYEYKTNVYNGRYSVFVEGLNVYPPYRWDSKDRVVQYAGMRLIQFAVLISQKMGYGGAINLTSDPTDIKAQGFYRKLFQFGLKPIETTDYNEPSKQVIEWYLEPQDAQGFIDGIEQYLTFVKDIGQVTAENELTPIHAERLLLSGVLRPVAKKERDVIIKHPNERQVYDPAEQAMRKVWRRRWANAGRNGLFFEGHSRVADGSLIEDIKQLSDADRNSIVDVGCGADLHVVNMLLNTFPNIAHIYALDIIPEKDLRNRIDQSRIHYREAFADNTGFSKKSFKVAISTFSLEYSSDLDAATREINRILDDDGHVFLTLLTSDAPVYKAMMRWNKTNRHTIQCLHNIQSALIVSDWDNVGVFRKQMDAYPYYLKALSNELRHLLSEKDMATKLKRRDKLLRVIPRIRKNRMAMSLDVEYLQRNVGTLNNPEAIRKFFTARGFEILEVKKVRASEQINAHMIVLEKSNELKHQSRLHKLTTTVDAESLTPDEIIELFSQKGGLTFTEIPTTHEVPSTYIVDIPQEGARFRVIFYEHVSYEGGFMEVAKIDSNEKYIGQPKFFKWESPKNDPEIYQTVSDIIDLVTAGLEPKAKPSDIKNAKAVLSSILRPMAKGERQITIPPGMKQGQSYADFLRLVNNNEMNFHYSTLGKISSLSSQPMRVPDLYKRLLELRGQYGENPLKIVLMGPGLDSTRTYQPFEIAAIFNNEHVEITVVDASRQVLDAVDAQKPMYKLSFLPAFKQGPVYEPMMAALAYILDVPGLDEVKKAEQSGQSLLVDKRKIASEINTYCGRCEDTEYGEGINNIIIATYSLFYAFNRFDNESAVALLGRVIRSLKPGGRLFLDVSSVQKLCGFDPNVKNLTDHRMFGMCKKLTERLAKININVELGIFGEVTEIVYTKSSVENELDKSILSSILRPVAKAERWHDEETEEDGVYSVSRRIVVHHPAGINKFLDIVYPAGIHVTPSMTIGDLTKKIEQNLKVDIFIEYRGAIVPANSGLRISLLHIRDNNEITISVKGKKDIVQKVSTALLSLFEKLLSDVREADVLERNNMPGVEKYYKAVNDLERTIRSTATNKISALEQSAKTQAAALSAI